MKTVWISDEDCSSFQQTVLNYKTLEQFEEKLDQFEEILKLVEEQECSLPSTSITGALIKINSTDTYNLLFL